ncbi:MAG TPA: hypothetical protein VK759_08415 [Rhizomicrobium sp.]|jgi:hypothetical protein|nr:hypothetical protein [Rhizomicrobium sp.]
MQISSTNLLAAQQAVAARPRAEVKPPEQKFEPLFGKEPSETQSSSAASAQAAAPARMGSLLDISV